MPSLKVIVEGYAKEIKHGWEANSTTTLIENDGKYIIVDPGMDEAILKKALAAEGLTAGDINFVFLTHYHLDHILNVALFKKAKMADGYYMYDRKRGTAHTGSPFGKGIEILHTPGHTPEHSSLLVHSDGCAYAIAGDLIWWAFHEKEKMLKLPDPFAYDMKALIKSREEILNKADFIIPGHGKMVKLK
jgi:glyoxylase-like metal-dependent hydrolase (beta-lactamase superfamily II)